MSASKQSQYDNLPLTPLGKHVDVLCKSLAFGNLGHTPRPSPTEKAYIAGFRDFNQGSFELANKNLTDAVNLARREATRDPTGNNMELLGLSLGALGFLKAVENPTESINLYQEALNMWEKIHGKDNPKLVFLNMDLSSLAKLANDLNKSAEYCQRAREIVEKSSPNSLELQGILVNLAALKSELQLNDEANQLFTAAIASLKEHKHPSVLMALKIYHQHLENIKNKEKAAEIKQEIDRLSKK